VAGRPPFTEGDIYYHHLHTQPESPRKFNKNIPETLVKIIMKCIEKDKSSRYAKPEEIRNDLAQVNLAEIKAA
jgi:hypothetical protein